MCFSPKFYAIRENYYDMLHIFPLSLKEFIQFQQFQETTGRADPLLKKSYGRFDGKQYSIHEIYKHYITYGGLPVLNMKYVDGGCSWDPCGTVAARDILGFGNERGSNAVTDIILLRSMISVMTKEIGNNISARCISNQISEFLGRTVTANTVQNYIRALLNSHLFYIAERFDVHSGLILKTMAKYYLVDIGFHNCLPSLHTGHACCLLENTIFFELLRRGYTVFNGKLEDETITFVVMRGDERVYIQVASNIGEGDLDLLLSPFRKIHDDCTKMVIASDIDSSITYEGFIMMNALEFLMSE